MTTYLVYFYHPTTGDLIDILDNDTIIRMDYERLVNATSTFTLTARGDSRLADYVRTLDMIAEVVRLNPTSRLYQVEETYMIRHFEIFQDDQFQDYVIVSGVSLMHLLQRRYILPEDDLTGAGGWSTKADVASTVIYEFVRDQAISPVLNTGRGFTGLTSSGELGLGSYVFERISYENLYEVVQRCAVNGHVDFRIARTTGLNFDFQVGVYGNDLTRHTNESNNTDMVIFELERDNIYTPQLTFDNREEQNVIYVFGQGPENDREIVKVVTISINDSPWNTIEARTDGRNNEIGDFQGLIVDGVAYAHDHARKIIFSFELSEQERLLYYRVRWSLYDTVTARYRDYEFDLRIMGIHVTLDENGDTVDIVLSEPELFVDPELAVMLERPRRSELEHGYKLIHAKLRKEEKQRRIQNDYSWRSEVAGARPRLTLAEATALTKKIGQMFWITNGRKPGEGIGAGTGVPAEWDGSALISGYSGTAVVA